MRRATVVLLVAVGLLGPSGCSVGDGGSSNPGRGADPRPTPATLRDAVTETAGAGTLRVTLRATIEGVGDPLVVTGAGEVDNAARRSHLLLDVTQLLGVVPDPAGGHRPGAPADVEVASDGFSTYVRSDLLGRGAQRQGEWLELWGDDLEQSPLLGAAIAADPAGFLTLLRSARGKVVTVGSESLRGTAVTHLRATLAIETLFADLDAAERAALLRQEMGLTAFGDVPPSMPAEVWIDRSGRVRKLSIRYHLGSARLAEPLPLHGGELTMVIELHHFDEAVDVAVPAAGQVRPFDPSVLEPD